MQQWPNSSHKRRNQCLWEKSRGYAARINRFAVDSADIILSDGAKEFHSFLQKRKNLRKYLPRGEPEIVGRHQVVGHLSPLPLHRQAVAPAVEVAVVAVLHTVALQQLDDLRTGVALIAGRIVQEAELRVVSRRLQRGLQANELSAEDFFIMPLLVLLIKPPPGPAQGGLPIKMAVVVEELQGPEAMLRKKAKSSWPPWSTSSRGSP